MNENQMKTVIMNDYSNLSAHFKMQLIFKILNGYLYCFSQTNRENYQCHG